MELYYALNGQHNGPVPTEQIDQLIANGTLATDVLVWRDGMENWAPYNSLPPPPAPTAPLPPLTPEQGVVCSVCHQIFPADEVIRHGTNFVCGGCKPQFVQTLREGVVLTGSMNYASFGKRVGGKLIDYAILYTVGLLLGYVEAKYNGPKTVGALMASFAINMSVGFAYPIFMHGRFGQTLGKMVCKTKVVTPEGGKITYSRAAARTLSEILSGMIFGIGYLMAASDAEKRALHDRIAGTRVIYIGEE